MLNTNSGIYCKGQIDPVDIHVGARLRLRRTLVGMSQGQLGSFVGISFQQVQKYERGINRMGASRLYQFANLLFVPVSYFFDEIEDQEEISKPTIGEELFYSRETLTMVRAYYAIPDKKQREKIVSLIKTMAGDQRLARKN